MLKCFIHWSYFSWLCQTEAMLDDRPSSGSKEVKQESVSLCPLGKAASPEQELLCIFGTGDFGRSLGQRLLQSGYRVVYGSRRPHSCGPLPQDVQVQHISACLGFSFFSQVLIFVVVEPQNILCMMVLHQTACA